MKFFTSNKSSFYCFCCSHKWWFGRNKGMSSRFGPRALGTDGTDFKHRQRIAAHYQCSVQYKSYLKVLFVLHFFVLLTMWTKVGGEVLVEQFGFQWPFYQLLELPNAYPWEYVWCFSFIPIAFALASFTRNKTHLLRSHYYGQFIMGILPCVTGLGGQLPELIDYLSDMKNSQTPTFRGTFPMVIIWYIFFVVALQIHTLAMYFSYHLMAAWQPQKKKD